jgi:NACHT domain
MDEALAKIYDDILEFHRRALRFFNLPTWRQMFRSVWKDFNSRFEHILRDLRRHKDLIESQATALHFQQYQVDRQMVFDKLNHLETAERKRKYSELLQWFLGADALLHHEDICKVRQEFPNSGGWLLKQPDYSSWKEDSVPRVSTLWLSGIPGAGKTVLASFVIENCKEDVNASTAFFYCKYDDPQRNTSVAVLRTLLSQLLKYDHDLLPWCYDLYLNSGQLSLSSGDLCKEILKAVLTNGDKTFVVVDGIDECDKIEARLLLNVLCDLVTVCDSQNPGKLRVMVVSQDEPDIRRNLSAFSELSLKVIGNEGDIHRFVDVWCGKIQGKFELEEGERNYIFESTCHRANGEYSLTA